MAQAHNFSYGIINPLLAYLVSCLGCFLGLQCTARARAVRGAARARWLLLAAVSIGTTGIWVMHFIAMLGYTISGQAITYNVPITILSMLIAVSVVAVGLFIVGFGRDGDWRRLLLGGSIIGVGVAGMHYMGMYAMRMPDNMEWNPVLVALSLVIAMVAGTAALWCAARLRGMWATFIASLIMGVAVSGMHYTGMAALRVQPAVGGGMAAMGTGASATSFLLPLILGISIVAFLVTAIVTMAPTEEEMREDAALMERIAQLSEGLGESQRRLSARGSPRNRPGAMTARPVQKGNRAGGGRVQAVSHSLSDAGAAPWRSGSPLPSARSRSAWHPPGCSSARSPSAPGGAAPRPPRPAAPRATPR